MYQYDDSNNLTVLIVRYPLLFKLNLSCLHDFFNSSLIFPKNAQKFST